MNKEWFQERLRKVGISQRKLAQGIGMRIPAVTEILSGKRNITFEEAYKISKVLGCSMEELYLALQNPI